MEAKDNDRDAEHMCVSRKMLAEFMKSTLHTSQTVLDEQEVSACVNFIYDGIVSQGSQCKFHRSYADLGQTDGMYRRMPLEDFNVSCSSNECVTYPQFQQVFDRHRRRHPLERLFTPSHLARAIGNAKKPAKAHEPLANSKTGLSSSDDRGKSTETIDTEATRISSFEQRIVEIESQFATLVPCLKDQLHAIGLRISEFEAGLLQDHVQNKIPCSDHSLDAMTCSRFAIEWDRFRVANNFPIVPTSSAVVTAQSLDRLSSCNASSDVSIRPGTASPDTYLTTSPKPKEVRNRWRPEDLRPREEYLCGTDWLSEASVALDVLDTPDPMPPAPIFVAAINKQKDCTLCQAPNPLH